MNKNKEIILKLKNVKGIKGKELSFKDSYFYMVRGSNGAGKTTIKEMFKLLCTAKNDIDNPIMNGESECSSEAINMPGINGKNYIIKWNFDGDKNKFVVIDEDGNKISKVEEIRSLFKFKNITVEDFMNQSLSAKGREEQKKLFLSFLTDEEQKKYAYLKAKEKTDYDKRTVVKTELEYLVGVCTDSKISKDEESLLGQAEGASKTFKTLEEQIKGFDKIRSDSEVTDNRRKEVGQLTISYTKDIEDYNQQIKVLQDKIANRTIQIDALDKEYEILSKNNGIDEAAEIAIRTRYDKGKIVMDNINVIKTKKAKYDEYDVKRNAKLQEWNTLDGNVKKYRIDADDVIKNSKLPIKDIEFEDDGVKIGGLSIKENQISKAKAMLIVTEMLCILNESPIMLVGSANDLDNDSLNAMEALAKKYDKILISDEVEREPNTEVYVVGYATE